MVGWGNCPSVCATNTMLMVSSQSCIQCSTFNSPIFTFFALWNASNGTRWWPASQDPPNLPPRSSSSFLIGERRAGLCWPCPSGLVTLSGDADLCLSSSKVSRPKQVLAPNILSQKVGLSRGSILPHSSSQKVLVRGRRLLQLYDLPIIFNKPKQKKKKKKHLIMMKKKEGLQQQQLLLCPPFANIVQGKCKCNPGFTFSASASCTPVTTMMIHGSHSYCGTHSHSTFHAHANGMSLTIKHHHHKCATANAFRWSPTTDTSTTMTTTTVLLKEEGCGPGQEMMKAGGVCEACKRGKFSRNFGWSPCIECPVGMTTKNEGSVNAAECLVPREADRPFSHA